VKPPEECASIEDVRLGIDALDREVVALIGRRARYVEAAARFKTSDESVHSPVRRRRCSKRAAGRPMRKG
jgi:isochorismate pyruvate lyase